MKKTGSTGLASDLHISLVTCKNAQTKFFKKKEKKKKLGKPGMLAHTFQSRHAGRGRPIFKSLKPAWFTNGVPEQPEIMFKTPEFNLQKNKLKQKSLKNWLACNSRNREMEAGGSGAQD